MVPFLTFMEIFSLVMSSQLLIGVPGKLVMGSFEVLRFAVIFESAKLTWADQIQIVEVFLLNDGVEHRIPKTPKTPEFEYLRTCWSEVEMSDEQGQALYPLILVLADYCECTDSYE